MRRKSDETKKRLGTLQPCRARPDAPAGSPATIGPPPAGMDPEAAKVWRSLAEAVNEMRTATAADVVAFERMVAAVHLAGRAHADPDARVTAKIAADRNALCWLSEFGLTPQKRQGVASLATVTPGDPLDEFV